MPELTLSVIPAVLHGDEIPFVLGFGPDPRPCFEVGGAEFRRGGDRCQIDWPAEPLALRAIILNRDANTYLMASAGPFLSEWWPLLQRAGTAPQRPLLSAAVAGRAQTFTHDSLSANITVLGPSPGFDHVTTLTGFVGGITDDVLLIARVRSLAVIKAALLVLTEYRMLVDPVPDIQVEAGAGSVRLEAALDLAEDAAAFVPWTHQQ